MGTLLAIAYTQAALKGLAAVEPKKVRQQTKARIDALARDPKPAGCAKIMGSLADGPHEVYRVRQGDYRIIYLIKGETEIVVLDIGHRKDIYR
jgi:mRNA interferase RelE/StbE